MNKQCIMMHLLQLHKSATQEAMPYAQMPGSKKNY